MSESTEEAEVTIPTGSEEDRFVIPGVPTFWVYDDYSTTDGEDGCGTTVSEDAGIVGLTMTDEPTPEDPVADPTIVIDAGDPHDGEIIQVGDLSGVGSALMMPGGERADGSPFSGGIAPWASRWRPPAPLGLAAAGLPARQLRLDGIAIINFFTTDAQGLAAFSTAPSTTYRRPSRMPQLLVDRAIVDLGRSTD